MALNETAVGCLGWVAWRSSSRRSRATWQGKAFHLVMISRPIPSHRTYLTLWDMMEPGRAN